MRRREVVTTPRLFPRGTRKGQLPVQSRVLVSVESGPKVKTETVTLDTLEPFGGTKEIGTLSHLPRMGDLIVSLSMIIYQ